MQKYRLLALDLDGTTLNNNKRISPANKSAIKQANKNGVVVMLATGRGIQRAAHFQEELGLRGPMVLTNGAEIWRDRSTLLERNFIQKEDIAVLCKVAKVNDAHFWGYHADGLIKDSDFGVEMFSRDWLKFGIRHKQKERIDIMRKQIATLEGIEITSSAPTNLEISLKGIDKRYGTEKVCASLGMHIKNVMAIGDNMNDLNLLKSAGLGVAMDNGDPRLKLTADAVTDTNVKDGVAKAIHQYLL